MPTHVTAPALRPASTARRIPALLALLTALFGSLLVSGATSADAATTGASVVREASHHNGAPYAYGAAGPSRFDCSGFTMYVFSRFGKRLPHNTSAQYNAVRHISQSSKQVGDLLFFRTSSGITHVGIYAGSGKMWDAPKTGDHVRLRAIYSSSYLVGRI